MNIGDFLDFVGLHYNETIDRVFDIYGVPDDEFKNKDSNYFVFYYLMLDEYVFNISFSSEDFKIESIFLGLHSSKAVDLLLEKFGIDEPKASFIGGNMDEIIDVFGIPNEQGKNFISYISDKMEVEFFFPFDERSLCSRIKVKWFYK